MVTASTMLVIFITFEIITYINVESERGTDEFTDAEFHDCHKLVTLLVRVFWLATNTFLLCLGLQIKRALLNENLLLLSLEEDTFHKQG